MNYKNNDNLHSIRVIYIVNPFGRTLIFKRLFTYL